MENETTMEQELDVLLGTETKSKSAAPAVDAGKPSGEPGKQPGVDASPLPVAKPEGEEDPLLKALDEIEEEKEETPAETPGLSTDQKSVLEAIPDIQTATNLFNVVQNYQTFTGALEGGKFEDVESMLEAWNPAVLDNWLEHVYQKMVAADGKWVERFIKEQEGQPENKEFKSLKKEVDALKAQLTDKQVRTQKDEEASRQTTTYQNYNKHIEALFDKVNFSKADRKWVTADLHSRVSGDAKVLASVKAGKPEAINKLFKEACREYVNRDKEVVEQKDEKIKEQSKKKAPLGGGAAETDNISDDINQVAKKDLETWSSRAMDKLFRTKK